MKVYVLGSIGGFDTPSALNPSLTDTAACPPGGRRVGDRPPGGWQSGTAATRNIRFVCQNYLSADNGPKHEVLD